MTKKAKKCLKIGLFVFIIAIALCVSIGATDLIYTDGTYDNDEIINSYQYTQSCEFTWDGFDTYFNLIYIDFTNSSGYFYRIYIVENVEYYYEIINDNVQDISQENIFDFLYYYSNTFPNSINGYFGSEWYYGTPLLTLYYDYENLYDNIYGDGYDRGYSSGYDRALDDLGDITNSYYQDGFIEGQQIGYSQGLTDANALENGLLTIFSAPIYILNGVLDFEILGINLFSLISGLITILLFAFIIRKFVF